MEKVKIDMTQKQKATLAHAAAAINNYNDMGAHFDVAFFHDGTAGIGDLHMGNNSWTEWYGKPVLVLPVYPTYTRAYMKDVEAENNPEYAAKLRLLAENPNDAESRAWVAAYEEEYEAVWSETLRRGVDNYVAEIADLLAAGCDAEALRGTRVELEF